MNLLSVPVVAAFGLAASMMIVGANAQEDGDIEKGLTYARATCVECHAILPSQKASPIAQAPTFGAVADTPGMTATALVVWFRTPHKSMPNLIIKGDDMANVIAYILSLRGKS